ESFRIVQPRQETKSLLRNQSARLEFLVEPRAYDRVRLTFRIIYDDLERQEQHREFADMVEFRQVESRRTYRPLHPNPYVVGRPLTTEDLFIGREEVFDRIASNLKGAHQDNVVALISQRRMGKTSILRRLHLHLGDDYVPVLVDLQGMLGDGEVSFFRDLADTICDELEELSLGIEPPDLDVDPGRIFRRHFLKDVRRALGGRRLLVMFDEFEVFEDRIRSGTLTARILPYFRSLMQHEKGVSFMLTGTHRLDELTGDYWGVLFNLVIYFKIGHLRQGEVVKLFTEPTRDFFDIDPLALDKVYQLTGGHPHFSQLVARELVGFRNEKQLAYVTVQDVNTVAERVEKTGQLHISYLWDDATPGERLLLLTTKELLAREGLATIPAAHRYLSERRIEPGDLSAAMQQLIHKEILTENAGQLSFHMDLLRLWIDRHHDLESFMLSSDRRGREE
ncbi:MAG: ATP-binding protein, partial [bacterium]|nr:ATP-binding protein [bacterium]